MLRSLDVPKLNALPAALGALLIAGTLGCAVTDRPPRVPAAAPDRPSLPAQFDIPAVDAYVAAQVKARELVGASLAVARDGQLVLARAYGTRDRAAGAPVTTDTAFAIGSVTKQFTCTAALLLAEEGKLSLDDPVARYYPDLTRAKDITLDDLGSHLSGYPDYYPLDFVDRDMQRTIALDELIRRYGTRPLDFEPRARYSYSNTGFVILGRIVEKVSGEDLGALLRRRVFGPLGMDHTSFGPPVAAPPATGHTNFVLGEPEPAVPEGEGWLHAAGAIYATASDLVRWDLALMAGRVLSRTSFERLTAPRRLADGRTSDYGCGVRARLQDGETVVSHSGAVSGFRAYNAFVPRTRSAVVLLVNSDHASPGILFSQLLGLLRAVPSSAPAVEGPPAREAALELFHQMQAGVVDRSRLGDEFSAYLREDRLRAAAPRLRALGEPRRVEAEPPGERGGMEVTSLRFMFADRVLRAALFRSPDGRIQQFLLYRD